MNASKHHSYSFPPHRPPVVFTFRKTPNMSSHVAWVTAVIYPAMHGGPAFIESLEEHAWRDLIPALLSEYNESFSAVRLSQWLERLHRREGTQWHWYSENSFAYYEFFDNGTCIYPADDEPNLKWIGWWQYRGSRKRSIPCFFYRFPV